MYINLSNALTAVLAPLLKVITCLFELFTSHSFLFLVVILIVETTVCHSVASCLEISYWLPDADKHHLLLYEEDHHTYEVGI